MVRIPVLGSLGDDNELDLVRDYYGYWRDTCTDRGAQFFQLYKAFMDRGYLKNLDDGAIKLYLYYGFMAKNDTGESWHGVDRIAEYFGVQTRTVEKWNRALRDAGLIIRSQDKRKSTTTFLVPFSETIRRIKPKKKRNEDNQELVDELLNRVKHQEKLFGPIVQVFHLFHWGMEKKKPSTKDSANQLLIITDKNGILTGHLYTFRNSSAYGVNHFYLPGTVCVFESPYRFNGVPVTGLAVSHTFRLLRDDLSTHYNLVNDLAHVDRDALFEEHQHVRYGLIDEVLDLDEDEDDEEQEEGED